MGLVTTDQDTKSLRTGFGIVYLKIEHPPMLKHSKSVGLAAMYFKVSPFGDE